MTDPRAIDQHCAAVFASEAQARRVRQPDFAATLDQWATNARTRAAAFVPAQGEMFQENPS